MQISRALKSDVDDNLLMTSHDTKRSRALFMKKYLVKAGSISFYESKQLDSSHCLIAAKTHKTQSWLHHNRGWPQADHVSRNFPSSRPKRTNNKNVPIKFFSLRFDLHIVRLCWFHPRWSARHRSQNASMTREELPTISRVWSFINKVINSKTSTELRLLAKLTAVFELSCTTIWNEN